MLTFPVSAASFLLDNNFSMDSFFKFGVPFLSRDEEEEVMAKATERRDRVPDRRSLDVKETDHESILFLDAVRRLVNDWLALGDVGRPRFSLSLGVTSRSDQISPVRTT